MTTYLLVLLIVIDRLTNTWCFQPKGQRIATREHSRDHSEYDKEEVIPSTSTIAACWTRCAESKKASGGIPPGGLKRSRRRPTFPHRLRCSIIGAKGLNCCVRDENRCFPFATIAGKPILLQDTTPRFSTGDRYQPWILRPLKSGMFRASPSWFCKTVNSRSSLTTD